jgi:hypothetical protein
MKTRLSVMRKEYAMSKKATWKPMETRGALTADKRDHLPDTAYAFPKQRKEPLTDAAHVRNALARFDQVEGVSNDDRELAFENIRQAARHFDVEMSAKNWEELAKS